VANLSKTVKTLHTNVYQNRSAFAAVMHTSISVCFYAPQCIYDINSQAFSAVKDVTGYYFKNNKLHFWN